MISYAQGLWIQKQVELPSVGSLLLGVARAVAKWYVVIPRFGACNSRTESIS